MSEPRLAYCCGKCPPIASGGYDCTCRGNPRCKLPRRPFTIQGFTLREWFGILRVRARHRRQRRRNQ